MRACVKTWIYRKNEIFEELQVWNGSKLEYLQEASKESRGIVMCMFGEITQLFCSLKNAA